MPAILDFDFARPASYDPTDMVGVACVRSLASGAHPGTYVGQDGLIKLAPHNLLTYSEQFDNAAWTKIDCTITANAVAGPDGSLMADTANSTNNSGRATQSGTAFATGSYTAFFILKADTSSSVTVLLRNASTATNIAQANFSLTTGASSAVVSGSAIEGVHKGNGWWLVAVTSSAVTAGNSLTAYLYPGSSSGTGSVHVAGAQINLGPTALDYVKTTSAANGGTRIGWGPREPYQNLLLQTTWPDAGANPTGWSVGSGSNSNSNSKWGAAAQARTFTTSASRSYITQAFTLVSNTTYSIGIRVEEVSGTINNEDVAWTLTGSLPSGCSILGWYVDGVPSTSSTAVKVGTLSFVIGGTYTGASITVRFGNGCAVNTTGTVKLSRPNLNVGAQAYNWYPTTSTAVYTTPFDLVGNWECHGAMSEGLRQNLALYSEQFDNAAWAKSGSTATADQTTGPDGLTTGDLITATATGSTAQVIQNFASTAAAYTASVFVKQGTAAVCELSIIDQGTVDNRIRLTFATGAVSVVSGSPIPFVEDVGGGWYRIALTYTFPAIGAADTFSLVAGIKTASVHGETVYLFGAQLEAGSSPSSYIPTLGTAVTRNADAISYTLSGAHATALSSQGTAVVEYRLSGSVPASGDPDRKALSLDDGTSSNRVWIGTSSGANATRAIITAAGAAQAGNINTVGLAVGSLIVSAFSYATNNANLATNGVPVNNDASCTIPAVTKLGFGAASDGTLQLFGTIKRVTIFSTALTDAQVVSASKPVAATAHWRTFDGTHRTASDTDKTVSCDIEADVDLDSSGEDGIHRVEFYVSVNGVLSSIATQTARSQRTHNSTPAGTNNFKTIWGYGITVDCAVLDGGTITVDATVFSKLGSVEYLPTLTIYNDTDGVDRRPSSAVVYYDYDNGDDSTGDGTIGNPFKNPRAAMNSLSGDVGGAKIIALGRTVGMTPSSSYSASGWSTSGKWALTFEAVGTDKTWQRLTPGTFSDPQDYILGTSGAAQVRMVFKDFEFVGPGPTLYVNGPNAQIDEVNCLHRSHDWDGSRTTPHVDDEEYGSGGVDIALNGASIGRRYSWGGRWRAVGRGPAGYTGLFNFSIGPFLGVAIGTSNTNGDSPCYTNGEVFGVRYAAGELAGLIQTNPNFTQLAGANVTVSIQPSGPHAGKMRIEATNGTPNDFGTAAGQIVGSTRWGVTVSSATSSANNGTFAALEGGLNGSGRPYCILDNASAVAEVGSAGFNMDTGTLVGGYRYIDVIHTDVLQIEAPHVGAMFAHVRAYDCHNTRSWVGSGYALSRCVFKNLTDGDSEGAFDFGSGATILLDCLFLSLSVASSAISFTGSFTGTNFVDCVWGSGTNIPTSGTFLHSNHFVTGSSPGTSPSTGAWFASDETVAPFSYAPSSGNLNTASGLQSMPEFWRFSGATDDSRGAWKNVATGNWSPVGSVGTHRGRGLGLGLRL